jgi:purine catabolism regulator
MIEGGLSLGDLLDQEELNLRLMVGDESCYARNILGVHGTEVEHPSQWLEPGWVMLTTGMCLRGSERAQRNLVAELDQRGLVALGFGVKMTFDSVPKAIVSEARERNFPIFEVPYATAFSSVSAFAARATLSRDFHVLRRIVSMQNYLMESLNAPAPENAEKELLHRLGKVLDSTVVLYRPDGRLEQLSRPAGGLTAPSPPDWCVAVWDEVCRRPASLQHFEVGELKVVSAPIDADGQLRSWLVVVTRLNQTFKQLTKPMVEAAVRLLGVVSTARRISSAEQRAYHARLIEQVVNARPGEVEEVRQRVAVLGLDLDSPAHAFQLSSRGWSEQLDPHEAATRLEHLFATAHLPLLLAERDDRVICLTQIPDPQLESLLAGMCAESEDTIVGIGRPAQSITELGCSVSDAAVAIEQLRGQPGRHILRFEDFELTSWLMTHPETNVVEAKVSETLGPLKAKPQLFETMRCYLESDLDVITAAKALSLHPNSLRYRLGKIEELVGESLRKPATIANLYLALTLDSLSSSAASPPRTGSARPALRESSDDARGRPAGGLVPPARGTVSV